MLPPDLAYPVDFGVLDVDVGIRRPRQRHQQHFLEQLLLLGLAHVTATEDFQYTCQICDCHWGLTCRYR
jgi:hypothetical protein